MIAAIGTFWCGFVLLVGGAVMFTRFLGEDSYIAYGLTILTVILYSYCIHQAERSGVEKERRNWVREPRS